MTRKEKSETLKLCQAKLKREETASLALRFEERIRAKALIYRVNSEERFKYDFVPFKVIMQ